MRNSIDFRECVETTIRRGAARVSYERWDDYGELPQGLFPSLAKRFLRSSMPQRAHGVIDFTNQRASLAFGRRSLAIELDKQFVGRPGYEVKSARPVQASALQPLWIFNICLFVEVHDVEILPASPGAPRETLVRGNADLVEAQRWPPCRVAGLETRSVAPVEARIVEGVIAGISTSVGLVTRLSTSFTDFGINVPDDYWQTFVRPA